MAGTALAQERTRSLVTYDNVEIDLIAEGKGPLIVLLPSRGRDSEDYDEVAAGLAKEGFRVLRPQPRGMHASKGPLKDITLHDLARDVATVIARENAGPAVIVGHAYGNWVARMTAVDHPKLVRGVVLAAAAAKKFPPRLSAACDEERRPGGARGRAPRRHAGDLLRHRQRSAHLAEGLVAGGERGAGRCGARREAVRLVARRHRAAVRPAGRHRPVQAGGDAQRIEGRVSPTASPSR